MKTTLYLGPTGIQGPPGIRGSQGLQGLQGKTGCIGIQGKTGIEGIIGLEGDQGQTGQQGETGIPGENGGFNYFGQSNSNILLPNIGIYEIYFKVKGPIESKFYLLLNGVILQDSIFTGSLVIGSLLITTTSMNSSLVINSDNSEPFSIISYYYKQLL